VTAAAIRAILAVAGLIAPPRLAPWIEAAARETEAIPHAGHALQFALGCFFWTAREAALARISNLTKETTMPPTASGRTPRAAGVACALGATSLGVVYMGLAGAPLSYPLLNAAAAVFGLVGLAGLGLAERRGHLKAGPLSLALGLTVLAVSLWGAEATGVRRWADLGGLVVQPSLIAVPLMVALFAKARDGLSALGLVIVAAALAIQPDRGVAGPLTAALAALTLLRPGRLEAMALAAAAFAFALTLIRPDASPAVPYVDRVLHTAFDVGWLAGSAVLAGSALLVVPAVVARRVGPAMAAFGAMWAGLIVAAAVANHPTPLVGYGGSAVVGYLLSLIALSSGARAPARRGSIVPTEEAPPSDASALFVVGGR
jgi:hypothetical protein